MKTKRHHFVWRFLLCVFVILIAAALTFMHFGGFNTGKSANSEQLKAYAQVVDQISIPANAKVIALGEATHGNAEFQQLKLDVFKNLVENDGVRAFAIEGDFGGCEQVNRYIHGGEETVQEAAAAIGFQIYQTDEMAELIAYMREYNANAPAGEDLRFYGFDMQRYISSLNLLVEACKANGVDTTQLEGLVNGEDWNETYDNTARADIITQAKTKLENIENTEQAVHAADMLVQYLKLNTQMTTDPNAGMDLRDAFMAENVQWILQQEKSLGKDRIFITGHNSHVAKWGSYDAMGKILEDALGDDYYVIGTDFYKTKCNLPTPSGKRTNQVFYSHDPLAKAAKEAGLAICWLDFSQIPEDSELGNQVREYSFMGNLGEQYSPIMRLLPPSYRMFQPPAQLYDSMILVTDATPTTIQTEE